MIPYFSTIETPIEVIVWFLLICFCGCLGGLGYLLAVPPYYKARGGYVLCFSLLAIAWFVFLCWLAIGDSTPWSKPVGDWLHGK